VCQKSYLLEIKSVLLFEILGSTKMFHLGIQDTNTSLSEMDGLPKHQTVRQKKNQEKSEPSVAKETPMDQERKNRCLWTVGWNKGSISIFVCWGLKPNFGVTSLKSI